MADKFLDQLKQEVEDAKAAQLAASQAESSERGKAFLDKLVDEVEAHGGHAG